MTYDRMEAKPIPGEHCHFCEQIGLPLVKTRCCQKWVCCDRDFLSFRGGGRCQFEHEHYSICHFHYNNDHTYTNAHKQAYTYTHIHTHKHTYTRKHTHT